MNHGLVQNIYGTSATNFFNTLLSKEYKIDLIAQGALSKIHGRNASMNFVRVFLFLFDQY